MGGGLKRIGGGVAIRQRRRRAFEGLTPFYASGGQG